MKTLFNKVRYGIFVILIMLSCVILSACEPIINIWIYNQTHQLLYIYVDDNDTFLAAVSSGEETIWKIESIQPTYKIIAKDDHDNILYTANYTREDFSGKKTFDVYFPPQ